MNRIKMIYLVGIGGLASLLWMLFTIEPLDQYFNHIKGSSGSQVITIKQDSDAQLLQEIEAHAQTLKEDAINARVDSVWKAIPGYNGREVDIQETLRLAKKLKGGPIPYVYVEIPPRIQLEDLGPVPVYKGNPRKPAAAFMINVAWGNEFIPDMLATLREHHIQATFFLDGSWLSKHPDIAMQIKNEGHELSNHAYSHKMMSQLSREKATEEILKTQHLLEKTLGVKNHLFAPPAGDFDDETVRIAHELGLQTVLWSLDTVDWKKPSPDHVAKRIARGLEPGSLILMHPTYASSKALPELIRLIEEKGLTLGTVSDVLSSERVSRVEYPYLF